MKKLRQIGAMILTLALTLALGACTPKTPAQTIQAAQEKMAAVKSMDAVMSMDLGMSLGEDAMNMTVDMAMSVFTDPDQAKIDMTMDMGELGSQEMSMYLQSGGDGQYTLYITDGTNWFAQPIALEDLGQYDAKGSMDLYLDSASDFQSAGVETLPGGKAEKFTGVIKGESLRAVLEQSGALDSLESVLGATMSTEEFLEGLSDMPVDIWVDQATGYAVRYSMDMGGMMSQIMEKAMTAAGASAEDMGTLAIDRFTIVMECSNFNSAEPFTIPEEALNATASA